MVVWFLFGYAIGSVPFAFLIARRAGVDVRVAGSGNVGATNVLRTSGTALGALVLVLDISKGAATVLTAQALAGSLSAMATAGAAAVIGHVYPVWLRLRGGKGVAVAAGVFSILAPVATLVAVGVFLVVVWSTRLVSLGSILAALTLAAVAWMSDDAPQTVAAATGVGALVLLRHRSNLHRLIAGNERRIGERG